MSTYTPTPDPAAGGAGSRRVTTRDQLLAILVGVGLVVLALAANVVFTIPVFLTVPDFDSTTFLLAGLVAGQLAFLVVGLGYVLWRLGREAVPFRTPSRRELRWIVGGLVGALAVAFGAGALGQFLGVETTTSVLEPYIVADPVVLLVLGVLSVFLVAPAEEMLFRGAIQTRLGRTFGPVVTVGLSSLLFASLHVFNFVSGLSGVLFATATIFAVGLVLGTVYERTGNLAVPVIVHGIYNLILFGVSYVALTMF
ncbi:CPBP family intramembrane glutamic endopeptidase [Halobium salinum]|uniref:CPBP family intramembrane glutamic endopeptidase n=1 Tax=Halobium salinum TaxID=1364940 RepID=A0ABD5PH78_9EURY|nr:type II CAAX endopeptidase family protein [Halobium salinum]